MYHKILLLAIYLFFGITAHHVNAQTNEKLLPSTIEMYAVGEAETLNINFKYDDKNRLTENILSFGTDMSKIAQYIKYDSENKPIEILKYEIFGDSIGKSKKYDIKYLDNMNIEIACGYEDISILSFDEDRRFLRRIEQTSIDSTRTKYTTTTLQYKDNVLHKRIENTITETNPTSISEMEEDISPESDIKSETSTYEVGIGQKSIYQNVNHRWILAYLKLEDIPAVLLNMIGDHLNNTIYHYNDDAYPTGWTKRSPDNEDEVYCKITYIKAK